MILLTSVQKNCPLDTVARTVVRSPRNRKTKKEKMMRKRKWFRYLSLFTASLKLLAQCIVSVVMK